jgi:hypothetical protein
MAKGDGKHLQMHIRRRFGAVRTSVKKQRG